MWIMPEMRNRKLSSPVEMIMVADSKPDQSFDEILTLHTAEWPSNRITAAPS